LLLVLSGGVCANDVKPAASPVAAGDPGRGRAIVLNRQIGLCLFCHSGPFPEERFQGNIGPSLSGVGARFTPAEIRRQVADPSQLNRDSIMPAYARSEGLARVAAGYRGKPILSAAQIDDVVAFLVTLK
jgi:sulfur-oxidizing protein SoxX